MMVALLILAGISYLSVGLLAAAGVAHMTCYTGPLWPMAAITLLWPLLAPVGLAYVWWEEIRRD